MSYNNIYQLIGILIFCCCCKMGNSQELNNLLFSNFQSNDQVIELTISKGYEGRYFLLGVVRGQQVAPFYTYARSGTHCYDLRKLKEWDGKIEHLVTSLPKGTVLSKRLVRPSFSEELDMFLASSPFSTKTVNFVEPKSFFGIGLTTILFVVGLLLFVAIKVFGKKTVPIAFFASLCIAFVLMDSREFIQHHYVFNNTNKAYPYIEPLTEAQRFIEKAKPIIGEGPWTFQGKMKDEFFQLFFKYQLADVYAIRRNRRRYPKGTFFITQTPEKNQKVHLSDSGYYLVTAD